MRKKQTGRRKESLSSIFYMKLCLVLSIALVMFTLYSLVQEVSLGRLYNQKLVEAKEAARPAEIQLYVIENSGCSDCFDISPVVDSIKNANVNIISEKSLDMRTGEAKELIGRYHVKNIPVVLVLGEIDRVSIGGLEQKDDALMFTRLTPPYTDAETGEVLGLVSVAVIEDFSCEKCAKLNQTIDLLKQSGISIVSESHIRSESREGEELISNYSIGVLPTMILSGDFGEYDLDLVKKWDAIGTIEPDGSYVTRVTAPPYVNLSSNKVEGLVSITYLVDGSCDECYDPESFHNPILQSIGIVFGEEKTVDISSPEGERLVDEYSIEKVPTILLSGGVESYPVLIGAWKDVGTVEQDNVYVFRMVEIAGKTYKDLNSSEIVSG